MVPEIGGGVLYDKLLEYNIPILKFCDKNKHGTKIHGIEVISPEELKRDYYDSDVIVSIYEKGADIAKNLEKSNKVKYCYYYDTMIKDNLALQFSHSNYKERFLHYLIQCIKEKKRKIFIYGHYRDIIAIIKKIELLDINDIIGISADGFVPKRDDVKFIDKVEIAKINNNQHMIIILDGYEESAREFANKFKIDSSCFSVQVPSGLFRLDYKTSYDPNLGYNIIGGFIHTSTSVASDNKKIGIIGDSNASLQWSEKHWIEYLIDEAKKFNIEIDIYDGAVGGHIAAQSLIKLIRDMSHMNLDIIIHYAGSVEVGSLSENHFIHNYQKHLFEKLNNIKNKDIYYGVGIENKIDNYFHQVHLMNTICKEFKIKFHSILTPVLLLKNPLSYKDKELLEHKFYKLELSDNRSDFVRKIRDEIPLRDYPCIKDFTNIFDGISGAVFKDLYHLFDNGNKIVARKIFELIRKDFKC